MKLQYIALVWSAFIGGTAAICGGEQITIAMVPEQVAVLYKGKHIGGGVIISNVWILTAGHNVVVQLKKHYTIRSGSNYQDQKGSVHRVKDIFLKKGWAFVKGTNKRPNNKDIALVKLKKNDAIVYSPVRRPARLPEHGVKVRDGWTAAVSGWGLLGKNLRKTSVILRQIWLETISRPNCGHRDLKKGQFCAGVHGDPEGPCKYDSGGPLIGGPRNELIGIVSYGWGPTVFVDIAYYRDWIRRKSGV